MVWQSPNGKLLYRIGDILISTNSQNPSLWFGGKWELLCPGKTLVCIDTNDGDFNSLKKTGGSKSVTLTTSQIPSHTHTGSSSSAGWHGHTGSASGGDHRHQLPYSGNGGSDISGSGYTYAQVNDNHTHLVISGTGSHSHTLSIDGNGSHTHTISVGATGGSGAHTNLQPFMVVYMWVRTA